MRILERYAQAVNSDNLTVNERTTWSDTDVLGAVGLAGRYDPLIPKLLGLLVDGKAAPLAELLSELAFKRARTMRLKVSQVQAQDLATAVLAYYRHGICQPCGGVGYQVIPGTPALGDGCPHCKTTGRLDFDKLFAGERIDLARWLSGEIDRAQASAGTAAMAKLAMRMEL